MVEVAGNSGRAALCEPCLTHRQLDALPLDSFYQPARHIIGPPEHHPSLHQKIAREAHRNLPHARSLSVVNVLPRRHLVSQRMETARWPFRPFYSGRTGHAALLVIALIDHLIGTCGHRLHSRRGQGSLWTRSRRWPLRVGWVPPTLVAPGLYARFCRTLRLPNQRLSRLDYHCICVLLYTGLSCMLQHSCCRVLRCHLSPFLGQNGGLIGEIPSSIYLNREWPSSFKPSQRTVPFCSSVSHRCRRDDGGQLRRLRHERPRPTEDG